MNKNIQRTLNSLMCPDANTLVKRSQYESDLKNSKRILRKSVAPGSSEGLAVSVTGRESSDNLTYNTATSTSVTTTMSREIICYSRRP